MGIIVENTDSVEQLNRILHQYAHAIIGRMGVPYRKKGINVISIALDAAQEEISALSGNIGRLPGVNAKVTYSKAANNGGSERNETTDGRSKH
jgi:putative iron-only hydrogenase system regulator